MSCSAAALCVAAYEGDVERARELLSHSEAPVNALANSGNVRGYTALTAACGFCSSTEIVDLLLARRADIDLVNHYGRSPLMSAVINQNCEMPDAKIFDYDGIEYCRQSTIWSKDYRRANDLSRSCRCQSPPVY